MSWLVLTQSEECYYVTRWPDLAHAPQLFRCRMPDCKMTFTTIADQQGHFINGHSKETVVAAGLEIYLGQNHAYKVLQTQTKDLLLSMGARLKDSTNDSASHTSNFQKLSTNNSTAKPTFQPTSSKGFQSNPPASLGSTNDTTALDKGSASGDSRFKPSKEAAAIIAKAKLLRPGGSSLLGSPSVDNNQLYTASDDDSERGTPNRKRKPGILSQQSRRIDRQNKTEEEQISGGDDMGGKSKRVKVSVAGSTAAEGNGQSGKLSRKRSHHTHGMRSTLPASNSTTADTYQPQSGEVNTMEKSPSLRDVLLAKSWKHGDH